jgi:anaerobic magnesium-protoporphyrin IX monomethyl ester cyclase
MAEVVLFHPRIGVYSRVYNPYLPLNLLSACSLLAREGVSIEIIDQNLDRQWKASLRRAVGTETVCFGVSCMTGTQITNGLEASLLVKEETGVPVVWGGVHPSLFPEQTLAHPAIDVVVQGEGEVTFATLVRALAAKESLQGIAGTAFKKEDGQLVANTPGPFLDLDVLPVLPYHLVPVSKYLHTYYYERGVIELESSRGCPHNCGFCYNQAFNQRRFRVKSPARVMAEIETLERSYGIKSFLFIDDSFTIDTHRVLEIACAIDRYPTRLHWGFQGRLDDLDRLRDQDLQGLWASGCRFIQVGVESGSPRILSLIDKKLRVEEVLAINRRLARLPKMAVLYNFICGFPTETREEIFESTDLAWRLLAENPTAYISPFHIYKQYPGTPLWDLALKAGYRPPSTLEEWGAYDWQSAVRAGRDRKIVDLCRRIAVTSITIDDKVRMLGDSPLLSFFARLYRPLARYRFRKHRYGFMPEARLFG